ncbi:GNAT family N-acetyltransferase [Sphingobacterium suaedae]|uniref:GNAT family N-acetyltransferase n=1 Tax=Sphingobacterium suaedae TaxID=1686402 RepID=A0ABW5KDX6_9SPHI
MEVHWKIKAFSDLKALELYQILQLRIDVFMLEQTCLYPECDNKDLLAAHIFGITDDQVVAYARLIPPGVSYSEPSIGRVVVHKDYRAPGLGRILMLQAISYLQEQGIHYASIRISAQLYLQRFYENLGFERVSDMYLEDEIPHIEMLRTK